MSAAPDHKKCSRCKRTKSTIEFGRRSASADGHHYCCKKCVNSACSKRRRSASGRRRVAAYNRSAAGRAALKRYRATPKGRAVNMWASIVYRVKTNPAYSHVEVRISRADFLAWAIPAIESWEADNPEATPSIDRVDWKGHYQAGNLRIIDRLENCGLTRRNHVQFSPEGYAWCGGCQSHLPLTSFYDAPSQPRGRTSQCRGCIRARSHGWKASKNGRKSSRGSVVVSRQ